MPIIDLHTHTTASDGLLSPAALVAEARSRGITTLGVADHDTVAALRDVARAADKAGVRFVPGIEITAVDGGKDIHMLGYFIDDTSEELLKFLEDSRRDRLRRAREMGDRLAALGAPIDVRQLVEAAGGEFSGKALARPDVARALVAAGHVETVQEAFDRFLAEGKPAYVPRIGASPYEVIGVIRRAGGAASLAHPGPVKRDDLIGPLADAGLTALECFHSEHNEETTRRYLELAERHRLAVTGGSDYHGPGTRRDEAFGGVSLPATLFEEFAARAAQLSAGRQMST